MRNTGPKLNIVAAAGLALAAASVQAQDYVGVVKRTAGHVVIEREGASLAPAPGLEVRRGDRVITGPDGYIHVKLRAAAAVSVGPDTNVALERFLPEQTVEQRGPAGLLRSLTSFIATSRYRH